MRSGLLAVFVLALIVGATAGSAHAGDAAGCAGGAPARSAPGADAGIPTPPDDQDCDRVKDGVDNCPPRWMNDFAMGDPTQRDSDSDGLGDRCDANDDNDAHLDPDDNCPTVANDDQRDTDGDGIGEACTYDTDGDGIIDPRDNCDRQPNPEQGDNDGDRVGNICDNDDDGDYVPDYDDNCPHVYNQDQADADSDRRGTACDEAETSAGGGGAGGGAPDSGDRRAPAVAVRLSGTQRMREVGRTLAVQVRCNEGCAVRAELTLDRRTARRLRVGRTVAAGTAALGGQGTTYVFMRFKGRAAKRLATRRPVRATLQVTVSDDAGNRRSSSRTLKFRR